MWHGVENFPIACDLLQVNIIIYSLLHPSTLAFIYLDKNIVHRQIFSQNVLNIIGDSKNTNSTIYMMYTPGHYKIYKRNKS